MRILNVSDLCFIGPILGTQRLWGNNCRQSKPAKWDLLCLQVIAKHYVRFARGALGIFRQRKRFQV